MGRILANGEAARSIFHSYSGPTVWIPWFVVAALVVGSCSRVSDDRPSEAEDKEAISALFASIVPLISSDGADGLFTLYTDDVVLMVPDSWTDLDRQGAVAFYTEGLDWGKPDPDHYSITIDEVVVMGDWAYVRTTSKGQVVPASGDPAFSQGSRHVSILRRQPDGAWKIARDIFHNPPIDDIE